MTGCSLNETQMGLLKGSKRDNYLRLLPCHTSCLTNICYLLKPFVAEYCFSVKVHFRLGFQTMQQTKTDVLLPTPHSACLVSLYSMAAEYIQSSFFCFEVVWLCFQWFLAFPQHFLNLRLLQILWLSVYFVVQCHCLSHGPLGM